MACFVPCHVAQAVDMIVTFFVAHNYIVTVSLSFFQFLPGPFGSFLILFSL